MRNIIMARRIITDKQKEEFANRFSKLLLPHHYVPIVENKHPGKYTANQLRNFVNGKTFNFDILTDFEKIFTN